MKTIGGRGERGGRIRPRGPRRQPANPEPDGATRANLARTVAYSGGRQDGPYTGPRRGVRERRFRGGRPQRAVLEADTAAPISDEADEGNEPDQPPALGDPLLRRRRHVPRLPPARRRPTPGGRQLRPARVRPQGPSPGDLAGARRRHQSGPVARPQWHEVQLHRIAGYRAVLAAAAAGPARHHDRGRLARDWARRLPPGGARLHDAITGRAGGWRAGGWRAAGQPPARSG